MQNNANREIGYHLGRVVAILTDQEDIISYMNKVRRIYESAPTELRDTATDTDAGDLHSQEGDFYDWFEIDRDHIAMVIADVVGKGVPASLYAMVARTMLKMSAQAGHTPKEVFEEVNDGLCASNKESMFVTVWFGIYSISEHKITYVNAGHNHPLFFCGGQWEYDNTESDVVIGAVENATYTEHTRLLSDGDKILLYTDGVVEAQRMGETTNMYGTDRLIGFLNKNRDRSGDGLIEAVYDDTSVFIGNSPQFDDITMLLLEIGNKEKVNV